MGWPCVSRRLALSIDRRLTLATWVIWALIAWACSRRAPWAEKVDVKEIRGQRVLGATTCRASEPGVAPIPGCEPFTVSDISKILVKPGDEVTLKGFNFRPSLGAAVDARATAGDLIVNVISATEATLKIPDTGNFGLMNVTLTQDGVSQKLTIFSNGGKTDHPIITAGVNDICQGLKFYDATGALKTGTKPCAGSTTQEVPPLCTSNGVTGCVTTSTFKSADLSNLSPAHIKNGVTIAGVTGIYPSAGARLVSDTNINDLTTFGSATPVGAYEFFDSAGQVYRGSVADFGPVTPGTSMQTVSDAATLYRQVSVSGDTNLTAGNIKSGSTIFGITGNVSLPPSGRVLVGTSFGVGGTSFTGALTLPATGKVLTGTTYGVGGDGSSGLLTLPLGNNVLSGSGAYGDPENLIMPNYLISFPPLIVRPVAPTITGVSFNFTPERFTLSWAEVTGASGYIVLVNNSQAVSWAPTDGASYDIGTYGNDTMIHSGTGTTVTYNTAVSAGTTVYFAVYSYDTNRIYSHAPTTRTVLSCAGLTGGTWIPVPGDPIYGTNGFCVQKYIPSNVGGAPTSQTGTAPWVNISQNSARSACSGLGAGYHLISNPEWMTIAANIASTGSNWSGGSVGDGALAQGHSDNSPGGSCAASSDDNKGWVEGLDCTGQTQGAMPWSQKRTRTLSNNSTIWDIGGNVYQWIDYNNASDKPDPQASWVEYPSITGSTTTPKSHLVPLNSFQSWWMDSWNSSQGIGRIYPGTNNGTSAALIRGAGWGNGTNAGPFTVWLDFAPSFVSSGIGFRCTWQP
jgi:hypothetical protein